MNITGIKLLIEKNLPILEEFIMFKDLKEIPKQKLVNYPFGPKLGLEGFDRRIKISDGPYSIQKFKKWVN